MAGVGKHLPCAVIVKIACEQRAAIKAGGCTAPGNEQTAAGATRHRAGCLSGVRFGPSRVLFLAAQVPVVVDDAAPALVEVLEARVVPTAIFRLTVGFKPGAVDAHVLAGSLVITRR